MSAAIFESLEKFFATINFAVAPTNVESDGKIAAGLSTLLFQPVYASYGEVVKLKKADAVLALASTKWDTVRRQTLAGSLPADIQAEKVKSVRDKLEEAMTKLSS